MEIKHYQDRPVKPQQYKGVFVTKDNAHEVAEWLGADSVTIKFKRNTVAFVIPFSDTSRENAGLPPEKEEFVFRLDTHLLVNTLGRPKEMDKIAIAYGHYVEVVADA